MGCDRFLDQKDDGRRSASPGPARRSGDRRRQHAYYDQLPFSCIPP